MPNRFMSRGPLLAAALVALVLVPATASPADAAARRFANCTAVHQVYSGGIAKAGVTRNRVGSGYRALKGHVKHSTALYNANARSDRDEDGIACELS